MLETTINAQTVGWLREEELARLIKDKAFDDKYIVQIHNFFSDVPLRDIAKFLVKYQIPDEVLLDYYVSFIKHLYPNPELEEMLYVG